jgi:UDP-N-acetylmuramate--alanine ligase
MRAWARGEWMVVEADESDGTFLKLPADVAIVTNIDPEHLDHFKTFDAIKEAFRAFVENLPFYGFAVMCLDHPTCRISSARSRTGASSPMARIRRPTRASVDIDLSGGKSRFSIVYRDRKSGREITLDDLVLPMPGHHNALNATAAIAWRSNSA